MAEHVMLIDLGRNDVGRVANDVKLEKKMEVEYYSHVMHISSTVKGSVNDGNTAFDVLKSGFPAGTVSGAPKIRAMEIINEIEPHNRSFYGGCVGYLSSDLLETCISLRTSVVKNGVLYIQAGAGVVHDSIPEKEFEECCNKAMALISACIRNIPS